MLNNKKGIQLGEAAMAVMSIILVAVLVIVSIVVFSSLETATTTANTAVSVVNETVGPVAQTYVSYTTSTKRDVICGTPTLVVNASNGVTIPAANYTVSGCSIKYSGTGADAKGFNNTNWKVTYPYTWSADTAASNASASSGSNFSGYPALVGLVGTITFLALVIGVLIASFAFGKKGA